MWFIVLTNTLASKDIPRYIDYFFTPSVTAKAVPPPSSDGGFVKPINSSNLLVSLYALLLSFQIPRSLRSLGMTEVG